MTDISSFLEILPSVRDAIDKKAPVVALESTIISHGMPFPQNLEVAKNLERIIESKGATPATIAIINGRIKVGLSPEELKFIADEGPTIQKTSRRDLPFIVAQQGHGATTVASTMIAASMAGIRIFATGGIGGVHRGAVDSMDISADLQELAKTNVAVVCGGAKAILDLPRTLEYLETYGVPVVGFRTNTFPAFYSRSSGLTLNHRLDTAEEIAHFLKTKWDLRLTGGVVVANPIPEEYSLDFDEMDEIIRQAISQADLDRIGGKDVSPYLLSKIEEITDGRSLKANIQLVYNNASLAADIAKAISL